MKILIYSLILLSISCSPKSSKNDNEINKNSKDTSSKEDTLKTAETTLTDYEKEEEKLRAKILNQKKPT